MEDPRWLRLMTIGLVLAALAVGYFLLSGRLPSNSVTKEVSQANKVSSPTPTATATSKPSVLGQNTQTASMSAYNRIASRTQGQTQTTQALPNTGFPLGLAIIFSVSFMVSGWGLRKFPH